MDPLTRNFHSECCQAPLTGVGTCSACGEQTGIELVPEVVNEGDVCREIIRSQEDFSS